MKISGYFEIGIYHTKTEINVGTLWRSACQLGAAGIFTIGRRYKRQSSDTYNSMNQIPLRHYETFEDFKSNRPVGAVLIGVEIGGQKLSSFIHPQSAIYLLGAEDHGLPPDILKYCNTIISLEAINRPSYNVVVAGSLVMYHRVFK
jgi:tRNA G18 (ribose-2'-O)-methylase SpoU